MSSRTPQPKKTFVAQATITSDEVMVYHDYNGESIVGSRENSHVAGLNAAGPLKAFLEPAAHSIYPREKMTAQVAAFKQKMDDPALAVQIQNSVAVGGFFYSLAMYEDYASLQPKLIAQLGADMPAMELPPLSTKPIKAGRQVVQLFEQLSQHPRFCSEEGSRVFQKALQGLSAQIRKERESRGILFSQDMGEILKHELDSRHWLPCARGGHSTGGPIHRLKDFATIETQDGQPFVHVDAAKLKAAGGAIKEAGEAQLKNSLDALIRLRKAANIPQEEFAVAALSDKEARARLHQAFEHINLKTLGGKMVLQALSNPSLRMIMVDRNYMSDYHSSFEVEYLEGKEKAAKNAGGFSEVDKPRVYMGCKTRMQTPGMVVEELVHHVCGLLYDNSQKTYARFTPAERERFMTPEKLAADRAMKAQQADFEKALKDDLAAVAATDMQGGTIEEKLARAEKRLRRDITMPERAYTRQAFDAEVATKIIVMETLGEWRSSHERRWKNLSNFVHDKMEHDFDQWVAKQQGAAGAAPSPTRSDMLANAGANARINPAAGSERRP